MKVLHINAGAETGGGRVHILSLLSQLSKNGHDLLVFEEGMIAEEARQLGINVTVLNQKSRLDFGILNSLKEYIQKHRIDIVHTHGARANLYVSLISRKIRSKWIVTVHSDPYLDFMDKGMVGRVFTHLNIQALKKCDHIVAVSTPIKKLLSEKLTLGEKITVVHNGIRFTQPPETSHSSNKVFTMTHIGRMHPVKRHKYLLDCVTELGLAHFQLNLIGDGPLYDEVKTYIKKLGIQDNVMMHGQLTQHQINNVLDQSDLFLLSSLSETFPLVLLESASRKVPFISTDVGDVKDLDPEVRHSWITPVEDKTAFISAIKEAADEWTKGTLYKKGEAVYDFTSKRFTLEKMAENTQDVYQKVIMEH